MKKVYGSVASVLLALGIVLGGMVPAGATITNITSPAATGRRILQNGFHEARAFVALPTLLDVHNRTQCAGDPVWGNKERSWWVSIGQSDTSPNFFQAGIVWDSNTNAVRAFIEDPGYQNFATFLSWNGPVGNHDTFFIQISIDDFNNTEGIATVIDETTLSRADGVLTNLYGHVYTNAVEYFEEYVPSQGLWPGDFDGSNGGTYWTNMEAGGPDYAWHSISGYGTQETWDLVNKGLLIEDSKAGTTTNRDSLMNCPQLP